MNENESECLTLFYKQKWNVMGLATLVNVRLQFFIFE